jgi:hydrogenase/urease accessory protein HupE
MRIFHLRILALLFSLLSSCTAWAHDTLASATLVRLRPGHIEVELKMLAEAAWPLVDNVGAYNDFQPEQFDAIRDTWAANARGFFQLETNGRPRAASSAQVELSTDYFIFRLTYPRDGAGEIRLVSTYLEKMPPGSHAAVSVTSDDGAQIAAKVESNDDRALVFPAQGNASGERSSFGDYVALGVSHILTGYDHLLFLGALLVVTRRPRTMIAIVSCFTLAHSVTLALAALDVVQLPSRLVEPLIAASIVFVAVENILRRDEPRGRWALTFAFGLIHGFGFASVLKETGLGSGQGLIAPLLGFNLGVELGQLAVAAVVLPLLFMFRRRWAGIAPQAAFAASSLVAAIGAYWLLERTVFS